jgi:nucleotide-binding universal stress UspA family protein
VLEGIYYDPEIMEKVQSKEQEALAGIVKELRAQQIDADPVFVRGRPFVEIIHQAQQLEADLIVIATHGRKGVSHLVFGSTAERVVRMAPCPVLTVKHPEHDFVG